MAKLRVDKIASVGVSTETTGSVFFDGSNGASSGDVMTILNQSGLAPGTGDYTAEGWFYFTSLGSENIRLFGNVNGNQANSTGWQLVRFNSDTTLKLWDGDSWEDVGVDVSTGEWIHIAVVRQSNTFTLYKNGVAAPNTVSNSNDLTHSGLDIGARDDGSEPMLGYISNVRLIIGEALYTSNFSVPTRELDVTSNTVFLGLYDGENIFADKTGNYIISSTGDRTSSPTPTAADSPIGITTFQPGLDRDVDNTFGPVFQGGAGYTSQNWLTLPKGTTTDRNRTGGRAVYAGGYGDPSYSNTIEYVNITSTGNGKDFGDLTVAALSMAPTSSSTRGVWIGKEIAASPNVASTIDYVTIASEGNAVDFGDYIGSTIRTGGGVSSSTRGIIGGGATPGITDVIQFITFATLGNGSNFGTLTDARRDVAGAQSTTRGLFAGGLDPSVSEIIDFVTMATLGNATDFGDLTAARTSLGALSSHTRAVFGAGGSPNSGTPQNNLDQVTIASAGNATDFGDLFVNRSSSTGTSNKIRGIFVGGLISPSPITASNTIDYITIASTGNAADFGDAIKTDRSKAAVSDSHGGL